MAEASIKLWNERKFAEAAQQFGFRLTSIGVNAEKIYAVTESDHLLPTADGNYFASFFELSRNPVQAIDEFIKKLAVTRASLG